MNQQQSNQNKIEIILNWLHILFTLLMVYKDWSYKKKTSSLVNDKRYS